MMTRMDRGVGEVLDLLDELKIADNTLVLFTSDNGPHYEGGHQPGCFNSNGPLKGHKRDLYEGGIRVPLIAYWPGKVKAGIVSDHISAHWGLPDPAAASPADAPGAFARAYEQLELRISALAQLDLAALSPEALKRRLAEIPEEAQS